MNSTSWTHNSLVLVTGGTGFIGSRVVRALLQHGANVRVFSRSSIAHGSNNGSQLEFFPGDVRDRSALQEAMKGVTHVAHLAAHVSGWGADPAVLDDVNVRGTRQVLEAALSEGVNMVVHVSSCSAISFRGDGLSDERTIVPRDPPLTEYGHSKLLAEEEVRKAQARGLHTVIVYPTRVFGPGSLGDPNAAGRVLDLYLRGKVFALPRGGADWANWVYADDVAEGIVRAVGTGRSGERYLLGGENATLRQFLHLGAAAAGSRRRIVPIPYSLGRSLIAAEEFRARLLHTRPGLTVTWYDLIFESHRLSCARAVHELGYRITPLKEAVGHTVSWLLGSKRGPKRPRAAGTVCFSNIETARRIP